jgi:hypothetical protein
VNDSPEKGRGRPGRPSQPAYPGEPNAWPANWFRVPFFSCGANQVFGHCAAGVNAETIGPHTAVFRRRWGQAGTSDCGCSAVAVLCGAGWRKQAVRTPGHGLSVSGDYSGAIPAVAVAVAVCGPSLDLGWNNCNRRAASVASWARREAAATGGSHV